MRTELPRHQLGCVSGETPRTVPGEKARGFEKLWGKILDLRGVGGSFSGLSDSIPIVQKGKLRCRNEKGFVRVPRTGERWQRLARSSGPRPPPPGSGLIPLLLALAALVALWAEPGLAAAGRPVSGGSGRGSGPAWAHPPATPRHLGPRLQALARDTVPSWVQHHGGPVNDSRRLRSRRPSLGVPGTCRWLPDKLPGVAGQSRTGINQ